jgi:ABC-type sugar transport system ATPase subunit
MKMTKSKLREIIREEIQKLNEKTETDNVFLVTHHDRDAEQTVYVNTDDKRKAIQIAKKISNKNLNRPRLETVSSVKKNSLDATELRLLKSGKGVAVFEPESI